uniref:Ovule protein n=1 Tax=Haemonchus contortus TaxID=6289 RepID=A0A7I5EER7_HAECO
MLKYLLPNISTISVKHCFPSAGQSDFTGEEVSILGGDPRLDAGHQVIRLLPLLRIRQVRLLKWYPIFLHYVPVVYLPPTYNNPGPVNVRSGSFYPPFFDIWSGPTSAIAPPPVFPPIFPQASAWESYYSSPPLASVPQKNPVSVGYY